MRRSFCVTLVLFAAAVAAGCATAEQWNEWKSHSSHFASGEHLGFSLRNRGGPPPRVTRQDVRLGSVQTWWGEPVVVRPEEIFEN